MNIEYEFATYDICGFNASVAKAGMSQSVAFEAKLSIRASGEKM